jgi:hypothetical protein
MEELLPRFGCSRDPVDATSHGLEPALAKAPLELTATEVLPRLLVRQQAVLATCGS